MRIAQESWHVYLIVVILFSIVLLSIGLIVYNKFLVVLQRGGATGTQFSDTRLISNVSNTDLYNSGCTVTVSPSNYVSTIANLQSTTALKVVCFRPGTYTTELLVQNKQNLALIAPEGGVTIQTTTLPTNVPQAPLDIRNSSNILVAGFNIVNLHTFNGLTSATQWSNGLYIYSSDNITISNTTVRTNGKNSILAIYSSRIQILNVSSKCWYFCLATNGTAGTRSDVYVRDSYFETNTGGVPDEHTMFWMAWSNWIFEDTSFRQIAGQGFISGGGNESDTNTIILRGGNQFNGITSLIARHHNYYGLNVYVQGPFPPGVDYYLTYGCDWEQNDCSDYPNSIESRFRVFHVPVANQPTKGYVDTIDTNGVVSGWALDPDIPTTSIPVQFTIDGPSGIGALFTAPTTIDRPTVNTLFGTSGNHGFAFQIPEPYKSDCKPHVVYAYAQGDQVPYTPLRQSPGIYYGCGQVVSSPSPTPIPTPSLSPTPSPTPTPPTLACTPALQVVEINQDANVIAIGGSSGTYTWSAPGGSPSTATGVVFTTRYTTSGSKGITLTSGNQSVQCAVAVTVPLSPSPTPSPSLLPTLSILPTPIVLEGSLAPAGSTAVGQSTVTFQNGVYTFTLSRDGVPVTRYELDTNDSQVQRGLLRIRESLLDVYPMAAGGTWYTKLDGTAVEAIPFSQLATVSFQHQRSSDTMVSLLYADTVEGKTLEKRYDIELKGKTLVVHVYAADSSGLGNYGGFMPDRLTREPGATNIDIPYLDVSAAPITMVGIGLNNPRTFFSSYIDATRSNANYQPWPVRQTHYSPVFQSFASYYVPEHTGTRPPLDDVVYITASRDVMDVMMQVHRQPSVYRSALNERIVWHEWDGNITQAKERLMKMVSFRMDKLWLIHHIWQPKGYDCGLPDHYPASDDAAMRALTSAARNAGYLFGLHQNYTDFYANSSYWTGGTGIALGINGTPRESWNNEAYCRGFGQAYRMAPERMSILATQEGSKVKSGYGADSAYLDVTTKLNFSDFIDHSPVNTESRTFRQVFQHILQLNQSVKDIYGGPLAGEGGTETFNTDNYQAGLVEAVEREIARNRNALVIPDFELKVIKPLMANQGMGFLGHWLRALGSTVPTYPLEMSTFPFDQYRATQIAYGHTGLMADSGFTSQTSLDDIYRYMVKEFYTFRDLQAQYLAFPVQEILYRNRGGVMVDLNRALKEELDFYNTQLKITYQNGLQIYVNRHQTNSWAVNINGAVYYLPPNGWVAVNPSQQFLHYSALVDAQGQPAASGTRADFVRSGNYIMADGRGRMIDFGSDFLGADLTTSGLAVVRPNGWKLQENAQGVLVVSTTAPSPSPSPTGTPLTCAPRFQVVQPNQEAYVVASGGEGDGDYLWITPRNVLGQSATGNIVTVKYATAIPNSRRVTVMRGVRQKHCVVYTAL